MGERGRAAVPLYTPGRVMAHVGPGVRKRGAAGHPPCAVGARLGGHRHRRYPAQLGGCLRSGGAEYLHRRDLPFPCPLGHFGHRRIPAVFPPEFVQRHDRRRNRHGAGGRSGGGGYGIPPLYSHHLVAGPGARLHSAIPADDSRRLPHASPCHRPGRKGTANPAGIRLHPPGQ